MNKTNFFPAVTTSPWKHASQEGFPASLSRRKQEHKRRGLGQNPNSHFIAVKCPGGYTITTVPSHAETLVLRAGCSTVLCQPTGGKARLYRRMLLQKETARKAPESGRVRNHHPSKHILDGWMDECVNKANLITLYKETSWGTTEQSGLHCAGLWIKYGLALIFSRTKDSLIEDWQQCLWNIISLFLLQKPLALLFSCLLLFTFLLWGSTTGLKELPSIEAHLLYHQFHFIMVLTTNSLFF